MVCNYTYCIVKGIRVGVTIHISPTFLFYIFRPSFISLTTPFPLLSFSITLNTSLPNFFSHTFLYLLYLPHTLTLDLIIFFYHREYIASNFIATLTNIPKSKIK